MALDRVTTVAGSPAMPPVTPSGLRLELRWNAVRTTSELTLAAALLVLAGWWLDAAVLKSVVPGLVTMKPNTAGCFLLIGAALAWTAQPPRWLPAPRVCALLVLAVAVVTLLEHGLDRDLGIDRLLFDEAGPPVGSPAPGRMAVTTALCFVALAVALLWPPVSGGPQRRFIVAETLGWTVAALGAHALAGYAADLAINYGWWRLNGMALHTAVLFVLLGSAVVHLAREHAPEPWTLGRAVTAGFCVGVTVLLFTGGTRYVSIARIIESDRHEQHSRETVALARALRGELEHAGALATTIALGGQEPLRTVYDDARARVRGGLEALLLHAAPGAVDAEVLRWLQLEARGALVAMDRVAAGEAGVPVPERLAAANTALRDVERAAGQRLEQRGAQTVSAISSAYFLLPATLAVSLLLLIPVILVLNRETAVRQRSHRELEARGRQLRQFIEHCPAAIAMVDRDMRYVAASRRWLADYRLGGTDIAGRSHYEMFPDIPERWRQIHRRCLAGAVERCDEDPFPRSDGTTEWIRWEVRPWMDGDGAIGGLMIFSEVITARKRAQFEAVARADELARSYAELEQYTQAASHDLREPLRALCSYAQLLQRRLARDAQAAEPLGFISQAALRMTEVLDGLQAYSHVAQDPLRAQPVDLAGVVDGVVASLRPVLEACGGAVARGLLPRLPLDREMAILLFRNLLENALKFRAESPPAISITAESRGPEWLISVADNGIGFASHHAERIFGLYQRLHPAQYAGSGVGLTICRKIVERHGGRIWAETGGARGAVFRFTLPEGRSGT